VYSKPQNVAAHGSSFAFWARKMTQQFDFTLRAVPPKKVAQLCPCLPNRIWRQWLSH